MYFSSLQPTITKDFIFSKGVNQESIMQHYTGHDVNSKKLFTSVLRSDKHVTCSYYKSKSGILYMHDFATNEHINCFEVVMRLYNCNYYQALEIIAKDFRLIEGSSKPQPKIIKDVLKETCSAKIQVQIKDFTDKELEWWKSFGISKSLLKKYHVFSIQYVFLNGELKFTSSEQCPIYGYYFGKDKNKEEKWKIYFPTKSSYRFIGNLTQKILQGYKQLNKTSDVLIINKSMKDTMACRALGFDSVSPNSETTFPNEKQIDEFKKRFKHIIVMFDNDKPGLHNLWLIRKKYPELNYFYIPKSLEAKDLTDLIKLVGIEKVQELVNQFMFNYKFKC